MKIWPEKRRAPVEAFAVQHMRIGRHEGGVPGAFAENGAKMIGQALRHDEGVGEKAGAENGAEHDVAEEARGAREQRDAADRKADFCTSAAQAQSRRAREESSSASGVNADALLDEIERAPLHLREDAADIFAENAEREQLNAGEEGDRHDQRGIAWHVDAEDQCPDDVKGSPAPAPASRSTSADIGPDLERHGRERHQPVEREMGQLAIAEFGLSAQPRRDVEGHADRLEADPGVESFRETRMLAHGAQRRDGFGVEQAEVAGALRAAAFRRARRTAGRSAASAAPQRRVGGAVDALAIDILVALAPFFDEACDHFRRMLQIGVHDHDCGAAGVVEPGRDGDLLAEIAAERDGANARIGLMRLAQNLAASDRSSRRRRK